MALSKLLAFSEPLLFWLLRSIPGPVGNFGDLLGSLRDHQHILGMEEAIRVLQQRQDGVDDRMCQAIRQTHDSIRGVLSAHSVSDVNAQLDSVAECGRDGIHTVLSPEILRNPATRDAFLATPEQFGRVTNPGETLEATGLHILGGDKQPVLVSPTASTLFNLVSCPVGVRTNLNSVSQPEWFAFIRRRKLEGTAW